MTNIRYINTIHGERQGLRANVAIEARRLARFENREADLTTGDDGVVATDRAVAKGANFRGIQTGVVLLATDPSGALISVNDPVGMGADGYVVPGTATNFVGFAASTQTIPSEHISIDLVRDVVLP